METKKLYRSRKNRIIGGVCGGLGEYFNVDPTIIRLAWISAAVMLVGFSAIIAYLLACLIISEEPY